MRRKFGSSRTGDAISSCPVSESMFRSPIVTGRSPAVPCNRDDAPACGGPARRRRRRGCRGGAARDPRDGGRWRHHADAGPRRGAGARIPGGRGADRRAPAPAAGPTQDLAANAVEVAGPPVATRGAALLHDVVVRRVREGGAGGGRRPSAAQARPRPGRGARAARRPPTVWASRASSSPAGCTRRAFDGGRQLLLAREDVGRHNAMDKVIGHRCSRHSCR